ncbi:MAG TPA: Asp-tRNA(Asn)/Glu-tRNA(Gln) amidotransferase subunit GatB, partial [Candidatus Sulfotelmatobacter sp.]|nr:Asp-tRNA(Asn)/Glu-tRNA(Gln) amidotransferase subunit GatB [Candidatus Sulfotelmatobacter sp.]
MKYETVIGLEVHAQLLTKSKMFCSCSTAFGERPNTNICPICTGQPGVLPVTNRKAVELAIKTALALNCKIEPSSVFARKHYFYPDLPKNYQISQYELPLATGGYLEIEVDGRIRKIGITRVHLEEDAGKLVHKGAARIMGAEESLVDYNRTGTPLMEIVSEPDLRSPREAAVYTETLAALLRYIAVCDAKMEEGSLRCDANISIRLVGSSELGVKTEVKNINSFRAIEKALISEEKRHNEVVEEGGKIVQETRFFDEGAETTIGMRSKEDAHDYRYFPEPDLVPVEPEEQWIAAIRQSIGELPAQRKERFVGTLGLTPDISVILIANKAAADFLEKT